MILVLVLYLQVFPINEFISHLAKFTVLFLSSLSPADISSTSFYLNSTRTSLFFSLYLLLILLEILFTTSWLYESFKLLYIFFWNSCSILVAESSFWIYNINVNAEFIILLLFQYTYCITNIRLTSNSENPNHYICRECYIWQFLPFF